LLGDAPASGAAAGETVVVMHLGIWSQDGGDTLLRISLVNGGLLDTNSIRQLDLWQDAGNDSLWVSGADTWLVTLSPSSPRAWSYSGAKYADCGNLLVTMTLHDTAAAYGDTMQMILPAAGLALFVADTGPAILLSNPFAQELYQGDTMPPAVTALAPVNGRITADSYIAVSVAYSDTGAGIDTEAVNLTVDTGAGACTVTLTLVTETQAVYLPPAGHGDSSDFTCTYSWTVGDDAGNTVVVSGGFVIDRTPPALLSINITYDSPGTVWPQGGAIDTGAGGDTIWFNGGVVQGCTLAITWSDLHPDTPAQFAGSGAFGATPLDDSAAGGWVLHYPALGGLADSLVALTLFLK